MTKPANSAARNQMSEFERQCYDWGWADSEERIIKLLEDDSVGYCTCKWGVNELVSGELVEVQEFTCEPHRHIALIKGQSDA